MSLAAALLGGCASDVEGAPDGGAAQGSDGGRGGSSGGSGDGGPAASPDLAPRRPYPIVLCHGLNGFKNIGPIDYFFKVVPELKRLGHEVYTPTVDPYNSSEVRGAQLLRTVEGILASTGSPKVILIGHSQGGLDARYVAAKLGGKVASVTSISTPHRGTPICDIAVGKLPGPLQSAVAAFMEIIGWIVQGGVADQNARAALQNMTSEGAAAFTAKYPNQANVRYFSVAGRSHRRYGDGDCTTSTAPPFISRWNSYVDPLNPFFAVTGAFVNDSGSPTPLNDGLVTVGSARWGTFLGCIPADHLDEIGQIAGQDPGSGNPFDHVAFYRELVDYIVAQSP